MPGQNNNSPALNGHSSTYAGQALLQSLPLPESRSEEITEIIGKMPSWIIRSGITLIGFLLLGILAGAYFFKYPGVVVSKITITSGNPPVKLVARSSLPIQHLFVSNNEQVGADQVLCLLSNAASFADLRKMSPLVLQLDTTADLYGTVLTIKMLPGLQLGELQPAYTDLCLAIQDYRFFIAHNAYRTTIGSLSKQVAYNGQLQHELNDKERMLREQLRLELNRYAADSTLVKDRIISPMEYEESKRKMLDQQMNTGSNRTSLIQNNLQQIGYQKDIAQLTLQRQSEENSLQQKIKDAIRRFNGQYAQWEQSYVIKSPIHGKVTFFKYWKENQFVTAGEGILIVIPPVYEYIAHGTIGMENAGRIKTGQKVMIKLPAYPFEEYGKLKGRITGRSIVAMDGNFSLEVKLENGLITDIGKAIPQQPELEATGEILTENKSILERLFERVVGKLR